MALLVLVSWALCSGAIVLSGLVPAAMWGGSGQSLLPLVRRSIWWGLLLVLIGLLLVGLRVPLASAPAAIAMAIALMVAAVLAFFALRAWPPQRGGSGGRLPWLVVGVLALAAVALALAALGPVTNYDSGLYHLGAIRYAADFATIPGLANVYFPFGYGNSLFSLAAFLGNGPWGHDGYRLANGLILILVGVDLSLRLLQRRWSAGTYVLLVAAVFAFVPMLRLADYWVTSPSQDSSVLAVTLVSGAYLVDGVSRRTRQGWQADAAVAMVTAAILLTMRPLMAVYAAVVVVSLMYLLIRGRGVRWYSWLVLLAVGLGTLGVQAWRDRILSGWLMYPLDVFAFEVPWRAPAATVETAATLWAARDPQMEQSWQTASGFGWIGTWLSRLPTQWETYLLLVLALLTILLLIVTRHRRANNRLLLLCMIPAALTVLVWFIATPPSYRFAWGPLILLGAIPAGWSLKAMGSHASWRRSTAVFSAAALLLGVLASLASTWSFMQDEATARTSIRQWKFGPVAIDYAVSPLPQPETQPIGKNGDLLLAYPVGTDQCWLVFPMCTGAIPNSIRWITTDVIQDGFTQ